MTPFEAITAATEALPSIHQDPMGYMHTSTTQYGDCDVMRFRRILGPDSPCTQIEVTVHDFRQPSFSRGPRFSYRAL